MPDSNRVDLSILETPTNREHTVSAARTANGNLSFKLGPFSYILKPDGEIMRRYPYANNRARWEPAVEFLVQGDWQDAFEEGKPQVQPAAAPSPR
ncbi:hypothetical protein OIU34_23175 [Pararhizobium sp. BT-229]|uniref:hypothetical protein n=1 Tax=Pararhizobium sp. BT-229 TaxID=2986923 RepID=UPI0021F700F9|nr:hypothetical protein [Pararhizobium sp. BT-229]MCV9964798.1 hypothetical protein [Pararhizobium sp. BT-229]